MVALKRIALRIVCLGVALLAGYAAFGSFRTVVDAVSTRSIRLFVGYRSAFAEFPYAAAKKPILYSLTFLKALAATISFAGLAVILGFISAIPAPPPGTTRELPLRWGSVTGRIWVISFGVWVGLGFILPTIVAVKVLWERVG